MGPGGTRHDRPDPGGRRWRLLVRLLAWCTCLVVTGLVVAAVVVPRVAGATPYTVLTGSMAPAYPPGTLVVVRPVDPSQVRIGDVVTYQLRSGEPAVATHRVVGVGWSAQGERLLTTRGDANPVPDAEPVRAVQLRGRVWYSLPWVGHLNVLLTPGQHQRLVQVSALLLFLYAGGVLWRGWRTRPRGARAALPGRPRPRPVPSPTQDRGVGDREREAVG